MSDDERLNQRIKDYRTALLEMTKTILPEPRTPEQRKVLDFLLQQFEVSFRCGYQEGYVASTRKEFLGTQIN